MKEQIEGKPSPGAKKRYHRPVLRRHGDVAAVTASSLGKLANGGLFALMTGPSLPGNPTQQGN